MAWDCCFLLAVHNPGYPTTNTHQPYTTAAPYTTRKNTPFIPTPPPRQNPLTTSQSSSPLTSTLFPKTSTSQKIIDWSPFSTSIHLPLTPFRTSKTSFPTLPHHHKNTPYRVFIVSRTPKNLYSITPITQAVGFLASIRPSLISTYTCPAPVERASLPNPCQSISLRA